MVVRFLGTSAGELYPGMWCRCHNCEASRKGSLRDRRQSAALYVTPSGKGDGVLIDFPSEIASQALRCNVPLPELRYLLVTHSHGDHWFPYLLRWRTEGARQTPLPILLVWGNAAVEAVLRRELGGDLGPYRLEFHPLSVGERFEMGAFEVTALAANHDLGREEALHYLLHESGRTMLYGLDGDTFLPETRQALLDQRVDLAILEATYGFGEGGNHRNFSRVVAEKGLAEKVVATHFSPHHCPSHQETERWLSGHGIVAAYDGMEISV